MIKEINIFVMNKNQSINKIKHHEKDKYFLLDSHDTICISNAELGNSEYHEYKRMARDS